MTRNLMVLLGALTFAGCMQNEAFLNAESSTAEDDTKASDVQNALSALPRAEVLETGAAGVPTFVRGNLGKLDTPAAALTAEAQDFRATLGMIAPVFRLTPGDLRHRATEHDALGSTHLRYQQVKNGLRVVGGDLVVHVGNDGIVYAAQGRARDGISLSSLPQLDATGAVNVARSSSNGVLGMGAGVPQLVYLVQESGTMSLAWEVEVTGERQQMPVRDLVYVNAKTGDFLERHAQIHSALNRKMYNLNHGTTLPGTLSRSEGGAASSDAIVNTNYDRLGSVYNCYMTLFNRDSFDNAGAALISSVHYSTNYVNAYWNGTQMVYGDGDGTTADNLAKSMDVTAHELTHAVTERTAGLVYSGQSGGLNESMSDVFGNVCEAFRDGAVSANTWMVGEDIWTPATPGDALRYMNDPKKDGTSLDTFADFTSTVDVHYSSGIGNLAFYLASQGGPHPRGRTNVVVAGIGITKAQQVWYRALTTYMTSSTTFAQARTATTQAATDLYGANSAEVSSIANAWAAVGVGSAVTPNPDAGTPTPDAGNPTPDAGTPTPDAGTPTPDAGTPTPDAGTPTPDAGTPTPDAGTPTPDAGIPSGDIALTNNVPLSNQAGALNQNTFYALQVPAGQTSLSFTINGGTGDADLYVKFGAHPSTSTFDCRPYTGTNNETCTFTNPSAGTWYLMVRGYAAYSGVTVKGAYTFTQPPTVPVLSNNVPVTGLSGTTGSFNFWKVTIPSGVTTLTVNIVGGTGDADLYVRKSSQPTTALYDCRPYLSGNTETCTITATAGDYYVGIRGYAAYSGVTLKAAY